MNVEDIVKRAEERLAEIEAEANKLRAVIAAAKSLSVVPVAPPPVFIPYVVPSLPIVPYYPHTPWPNDGITFTTCVDQAFG